MNNIILSILLLTSFALSIDGKAAKVKRPNVIFILFDDMGYSDLSCYGAKTVKTPNIDRLAKEGLQFTNFLTGASICTPSRACFLTGAYPQRCGSYMGINENRQAHWFLGLNPEEITLAEQFKKKDYTTLMVGKWHLGTEEKFSYYKQGFDHYYGAPSNFSHSPIFYDEKKVVYKKTPINKLTELYTSRIIQNIAQYKKTPFFLYYAHNYPHTPYKAGVKFQGSSQGGVRGDVIQELDWSVGEIVKALEQNNMLDNTIIVISSDNGATSNKFVLPFKGTKYVSFEGGHRVPFIIYSKGLKRTGLTDVEVHAMDVFPTLSELIKEPLAKDRKYDGISLVPFMNNKAIARKPQEEPFYYYNASNLQAIRLGEWKLHFPRQKEQLPFWDKNKAFIKLEKAVLYNIVTDVGEKIDVADKHPNIVNKLTALAEEGIKKLGEYKQRGTEQRATGSLFSDVPIVVNTTDWEKIPYQNKKAAVDNFKGGHNARKKKGH